MRRLGIALLLAGCTEFPAASDPCVDDESCGAGWYCRAGGCYPLDERDAASPPTPDGEAPEDGAPRPPDGGPDGHRDAAGGADARPDGPPPDAGPGVDARPDAGRDLGPDGALDAARDGAPDAACEPLPAELCNDQDDDCDGRIDEDFPGVGDPCMAGEGACVAIGVVRCSDDGLSAACDARPGDGGAERCNSIDDDCDGAVDEGYGAGDACRSGTGGCARDGVKVCLPSGEDVVCGAAPGAPSPELCNAADDDCDGRTDEAFALGSGCTVGSGACEAPGVVTCDEAMIAARCQGVPGRPVAEQCNQLDDDCDGQTDEDFAAELGALCPVGQGACRREGVVECNPLDGLTTCDVRPGQPSPERCNGADDDCDGQTDEAFDVGADCVTESARVPGCRGRGHVVCQPDGTAACDGQVDVDEVCDGFDNDCDRVVDEGFDLLVDESNCGGCGQVCGPYPNAEAVCAGGLCFTGRCRDFFHDQTIDEGCETQVPGRVLFVDAMDGDDDDNDGSQDLPFRDLPRALAVAGNGDVVQLAGGRYTGRVDVVQDRLTLRGRGPGTTFVDGRIGIRGDFSRVENLTLDALGDDVGIDLQCGQGCVVRGNSVTNVGRLDTYHELRAGILIQTGDDHVVEDNEVTLVRGGKGLLLEPFDRCLAGPGGAAVGIQLEAGATGSRVVGNRVSNIEGGRGADDLQHPDPLDPCVGWTGGIGGRAYGINLSDRAQQCVVAGNRIVDVRGGRGGDGDREGNGGTGGLAAGVRLVGSDNRLYANTISQVVPGGGGTGGDGVDRVRPFIPVVPGNDGVPARSFGLFFDPPRDGDPLLLRADLPSLDNLVTDTNTVDGDPVIYLYEASCRDVRGLRLTGASNPTNLGKIVVVGCRGVTIADNEIAHQSGLAAEPNARGLFDQSPGHAVAGIYLLGTRDAVVTGNTVSDVEGGTGGAGPIGGNFGSLWTSGSDGGLGAGILLRMSPGATLRDNELRDVRGGRGGLGGSSGGGGGRGGRGAGVAFSSTTGSTLSQNAIAEVAGGEGGPGGEGPNPLQPGVVVRGVDGPAARGYGLFIDEATSLDNRVERTNTLDGLPIVYVKGEPDVRVENVRLHRSGNPTNLGKIVVIDSPRAVIRNNLAVGYVGEPGITGSIGNVGGTGASARGLYVWNSDDARVEGNQVQEITGGLGGTAGLGAGGGIGGTALGIEVRGSARVRLVANVVHTISGANGGAGGREFGPQIPQGPDGPGGDAAGVRAIDSPDLESLRDLVYGVLAAGAPFGVLVQRTARGEGAVLTASITNATVDGTGGDRLAGDGISAGDGTDVEVTSCIVSRSGRVGVSAYASGAFTFLETGAGRISVAFSNVWSTGIPAFEGVRVGAGNLQVDPRYVDRLNGVFELRPDSPSIDTGDPAADCDGEPAPPMGEDCALDQGHAGNTRAAHSP